MFLGDCQSETGDVLLVFPTEYRKPAVAARRRFLEDARVAMSVEQSVVFPEAVQGTAGRYRARIRA
jgi:hypothetical protein